MTLTTQFDENDSIIAAQKTLYHGFFELQELRIKFRLFAGGWSDEIKRELLVRRNATVVLLYDPKQDAVVLIEQFRPGALQRTGSPWLFELVAGIIEIGETPEGVALREAHEEAGCPILQLIPVYNYLSSPGGSNERMYLYCGLIDSSGVGGIYGLAHEHEDIQVHVVPRAEAFAMVESGVIDNASTIIALQWLQLNAAAFSFSTD